MLYKFLKVTLLSTLLTGCISNSVSLSQGIHSFQIQDYRAAFIRLKPAAEKGSPEAQYAVGYMYYYGYGVVEDRRKAWYWITKSAHAGNRDAAVAIELLREGPGRPSSG